MGKIWLGESNGCWLRLWDETDFRGHSARLYGPADYPYLRIASGGWAAEVRSLQAGPNVYVQCFEDLNFYDSVVWILPNQRVQDVHELPCGDEIDSIRLFDRPPFAHEPGYAAYMLWAETFINARAETKF